MKIDATAIQKMMQPMAEVIAIDGGFSVATHCLYPSNEAVNISIRKYTDCYVVSDDRGAVHEVNSAGIQFHGLDLDDIDKKLKHVVKHQGLVVSNGAILSPQIPLEAIPAAVLLVANASKDSADWMLGNLKFAVPRDFKKDVDALLKRHFRMKLIQGETIVGQSNKPHHFGHTVILSGDRKLLIDTVINDSSSINAKVIANIDVKMLNNPSLMQHIIYDDTAGWKSSDLKLLEMGANPLPFSRAESIIPALAA